MIDFERAVLGACLVDPANFGVISERLRADHFTAPGRAVFCAMRSMQELGQPIELISLKNRLMVTETLEIAGGIAAVAGLSDGLPKISRDVLLAWVAEVREAGRRRRLAQETRSVLEASEDMSLTSGDLLARLQAVAFDLDTGTVNGQSFGPSELRREAGLLIDEMAKAEDGIIGIPSGIPELDKLTGGFRPGQYVALGARPSVGKSSLALQIADHAANLGKPVAFFSLEMEARSLALIRACGESQVSKFQIQVTRGEGPHMERLYRAIHRQAETPMYVEKLSSPSLGPIRSRAARIKAEHGLGLVVIDYLQLMRSESKRSNRNEEITEISSGIKAMAGVLGCPVIVCAQLNREAADKTNTRPRLSQFRDSGSIEADADVAILLHRVNEAADRTIPVDVDLIVDKNREGSCGDVQCSFVGKYQRFEPRAQEAFL